MRHKQHRRAKLRFADIAREAFDSLSARPGRSALLCLGAALGTAALAASLTLAASAAARVSAQFDELRSTRITVTNPTDPQWLLPANLDHVRHLAGVTAAGTEQSSQDATPIAQLGNDITQPIPTTVTAASVQGLQAQGAQLRSGRMYDDAMSARGDSVVLLGAGLARSLHLPAVDDQTQITIGGVRALVIGVIEPGPKGDPNLLLGAYVPSTHSLLATNIRWQSPTVIVNTTLRATDGIANAAPLALAPNAAKDLIVETPPDPQGLRSAVTSQLQLLLLVLGAVSLAIGAVVIGISALSAITQRRTEIALRRALGTTRSAIYLQILIETGLTGVLGGVIGVYIGELTTACISAANGWPISTSLILIPAGAVLGLAAGTVAGLYPAGAAASAQPADALRT